MSSSVPGQKPIRYVDLPDSLQACLQDLRTCDTIAFDLEFDSHRHSYGVTLCLVQVATPEICYVIDPFAPVDLAPLYAIFEDELILKIMHSPGEDLRLLHGIQCYPKNLFDTEVTARLLNYEQTSLSAMLQEKLGIAMNKGQQRSNWLRRPLSEAQILYAAEDVAWLHRLKEVLGAEAEAKGVMPFVLEEQEALSTTIHAGGAKDSFLKQADQRSLSPYDQHVLNALFVYRDGLARQLNKPAYQVLDESLVRGLASGSLQPQQLPGSKGVYGGFRNAAFADRLERQLRSICHEADVLGLSKKIVRQRNGLGERVSREDATRDKEQKFVPIQQALTEQYGAHAARFILSNGTVNDLLKRATTIGAIKRSYKQRLIRKAAAELGIDLSNYE